MSLTLSKIASQPDILTTTLNLPTDEAVVFRPLAKDDVDALAIFLDALSAQTREQSTFESYDRKMAKKLCGAIGKYDKLRLVILKLSGEIIGLLEFSFGIPAFDKKRFLQYGIKLNQKYDCRFGPTLRDDYQNKKVGTTIFPIITNIAKRFGKKRIILWGGVLTTNKRAVRFYEKNGFSLLGKFKNDRQKESFDMILTL